MKNRNLIKKAVDAPAKRQYDKLVVNLKEELKPETFMENLIVNKIAFDYMRLYKIMEFETKEILSDDGMRNHLGDRTINGFISYKNSIEKSINASYNMVKIMIRNRIGPKIFKLGR